MVTETPAAKPKEKTNWLPALAIGLGGAGVIAGIYFFTKKPPGVDQGGTVTATFSFDYLGDGGTYVLLIRFGVYRIVLGIDWFDPEGGMDQYTLEVELPGPDSYSFDIECKIPDAAAARTYDAEASILSPDMEPGQDWITRIFSKQVLTVREA